MSDDLRAAQADEARSVFSAIEQRVRNDQMLSDEGKREQIAAAHESANKKIEALQQESVTAKAKELKKLETRPTPRTRRKSSGSTTSAATRFELRDRIAESFKWSKV